MAMGHRKVKKLRRLLALTLAGVLCGGAVAGAAEDPRTAEYHYMGNAGAGSVTSTTYSPLEVINAAAAYEKGYSGAGVTVGIYDDGLNANHQEFSGKTNTPSCLPANWPVDKADEWYVGADMIHGTHVAGIIAAAKDGEGMHGVAYNANVNAVTGNWELTDGEVNITFPTDDNEPTRLLGERWSGKGIKVTNHSYNSTYYEVPYLDIFDEIDPVGYGYYARNYNEEEAWLWVYSANNLAVFSPALEAFGYLYHDATMDARVAANNVISVGALSNTVYRDSSDNNTIKNAKALTAGEMQEKRNVMSEYTQLALGSEEKYVLAPGDCYSANAADTEGYIKERGTSMAAPMVTGVGALVQEAFPYLTGKQLGDVLLSTTNKNVDFSSADNRQIVRNFQQQEDGEWIAEYSVFGLEGYETSSDAIAKKLSKELLANYRIRVFKDVNPESMLGQGVVDAGRAVCGLGELNARRLTNANYTEQYTINGAKQGQAIYRVDTKGYDSEWSNNMGQVTVGWLAADSSEADLRQRYNYYNTGTYTEYFYDYDAKTGKKTQTSKQENISLMESEEYGPFLRDIIAKYNEYVQDYQSQLVGKNVGLRKTGEGLLTLSGENTYLGATIVDQGELNITGSVKGDLYAENSGILRVKTVAENQYAAAVNDNSRLYLTGNAEGKFINHGTLSGQGYIGLGSSKANTLQVSSTGTLQAVAGGSSRGLTIDGNVLLEDGSTVYYANNGTITVTGEAKSADGAKSLLAVGDGQYTVNQQVKVQDIINDGKDSTTISYSNTEGQVLHGEGTSLLAVVYHTNGTAEAGDDYLQNQWNDSFEAQVATDLANQGQTMAMDTLAALKTSGLTLNQGGSDTRYDKLFNLPGEQLQQALKEISDNPSTAATAVMTQQSTMTGRMIASRLAAAPTRSVTMSLPMPKASLAEGGDDKSLKLTLPVEDENDLWFKYDKSWGQMGTSDLHGTGYTLGWDKLYTPCSRFGVTAGFESSGSAGWRASHQTKDYRLGLYNGYRKDGVETMVYADFGWQHHKNSRTVSELLQEQARADYNGRVLELGAEFKYDFHADDGKIFHVAPYIGTRFSHYWQKSYQESGNYGIHVHDFRNNYFDTELGLEISRDLPLGSYTWRLGYKHVWCGADPSVYFNYLGAENQVLASRSTSEKDFITASLSGKLPLGSRWELEGETRLQLGAQDKFYGVSATFKYHW